MDVLKEQMCLGEVKCVLGETCKVARLQELGCPN